MSLQQQAAAARALPGRVSESWKGASTKQKAGMGIAGFLVIVAVIAGIVLGILYALKKGPFAPKDGDECTPPEGEKDANASKYKWTQDEEDEEDKGACLPSACNADWTLEEGICITPSDDEDEDSAVVQSARIGESDEELLAQEQELQAELDAAALLDAQAAQAQAQAAQAQAAQAQAQAQARAQAQAQAQARAQPATAGEAGVLAEVAQRVCLQTDLQCNRLTGNDPITGKRQPCRDAHCVSKTGSRVDRPSPNNCCSAYGDAQGYRWIAGGEAPL
jgi:hypothetical protein